MSDDKPTADDIDPMPYPEPPVERQRENWAFPGWKPERQEDGE
jgi:hypothetical protein